MHKRLYGTIALTCCAVAIPRAASAIPVFANGQGVSCQACHNVPPSLNAYGRYIYATNFARGINTHAQMQENLRDPISFALDANGSNTPAGDVPKTYVGLANTLSGGYLGSDFSYLASVPLVSGGYPSQRVDQLWAAYNGLSGGNGSLQVGKFPTPVLAPWLSGSVSLRGYALGAIPVGLNTSALADNRWGASYSQIGHNGLVGNVSYLSNTGSFEGAYNNAAEAGGEGQAYVGSLLFMNPGSHFTGGIATMTGGFPLPSGAKDTYTRQFALLSYQTSPKYSFDTMVTLGHDKNPNDGATGAATSNGLSFEGIYNAFDWLHFNARYDRTNDGFGSIGNAYITDVAFSIRPNLVLQFENASAVGQRPVMSYQLFYAGPWLRRPNRFALAAARANAQVANADKPAAAGDVKAGAHQYATNCAACHGAAGAGGTGPSLIGIGDRKTFDQAVAFIEAPTVGGLMPKLYPGAISVTDVQDVAAYIRTFH